MIRERNMQNQTDSEQEAGERRAKTDADDEVNNRIETNMSNVQRQIETGAQQENVDMDKDTSKPERQNMTGGQTESESMECQKETGTLPKSVAMGSMECQIETGTLPRSVAME